MQQRQWRGRQVFHQPEPRHRPASAMPAAQLIRNPTPMRASEAAACAASPPRSEAAARPWPAPPAAAPRADCGAWKKNAASYPLPNRLTSTRQARDGHWPEPVAARPRKAEKPRSASAQKRHEQGTHSAISPRDSWQVIQKPVVTNCRMRWLRIQPQACSPAACGRQNTPNRICLAAAWPLAPQPGASPERPIRPISRNKGPALLACTPASPEHPASLRQFRYRFDSNKARKTVRWSHFQGLLFAPEKRASRDCVTTGLP